MLSFFFFFLTFALWHVQKMHLLLTCTRQTDWIPTLTKEKEKKEKKSFLTFELFFMHHFACLLLFCCYFGYFLSWRIEKTCNRNPLSFQFEFTCFNIYNCSSSSSLPFFLYHHQQFSYRNLITFFDYFLIKKGFFVWIFIQIYFFLVKNNHLKKFSRVFLLLFVFLVWLNSYLSFYLSFLLFFVLLSF